MIVDGWQTFARCHSDIFPGTGRKNPSPVPQNYFKGLEIYFSAFEIYFQAAEIYFSAAEKVFVCAG
jgi:hypothetical protein